MYDRQKNSKNETVYVKGPEQEDQKNLVALVALLISTAGFKQELSSVPLGSTSFTLFHVFVVASIAFGILLYIHVFMSARLLLLRAWREKKRSISLILLRLLFLVILIMLPLSTMTAASLDWLNKESCNMVSTSADIDPFGIPYGDDGEEKEVCKSGWFTLGAFASAALVSGAVLWFVMRQERAFNKLPPNAKKIAYQIQEYAIFQALSDNHNSEVLQAKIDKLKKDYKAEMSKRS